VQQWIGRQKLLGSDVYLMVNIDMHDEKNRSVGRAQENIRKRKNVVANNGFTINT